MIILIIKLLIKLNLKKVAVGQIEGLEDQIQLKSLEFEKLKANSVDDKKKLEKNKEKLECSLELVKNLLSQKKQLKSKVDEGNVFFQIEIGYYLLY